MSLAMMMDGQHMPSKEYNFLSGQLPPGLTYTNSSATRYYWNASGSLATAAANEPIFEHNPLTLALRGMRWEMEQRTNHLLYSSEDNPAWVDVNTSRIATGTSIIPGKTPMLVTTTLATGRLSQVIGVMTGASECVWAIVEQGTALSTRVRLWDNTAALTVADSMITWSTEAITGSGTYGGVKLKDVGPNGGKLYLLWASAVGVAGNGRRYYLYPDPGGGVGSSYVHHMQLEAGVYPSSIIVTGASAVIRQPDVLTATSISPWYRQDEGTVVFEGIITSLSSGSNGIYCVHDGTNNGRLFQIVGPIVNINAWLISGGVVQWASANMLGATVGSVFRSSYGYKENSLAADVNAGAVQTDDTATLFTATGIRFGAITPSGSNGFMGYARRFQYYNTRLPNSQIQGLSRV